MDLALAAMNCASIAPNAPRKSIWGGARRPISRTQLEHAVDAALASAITLLSFQPRDDSDLALHVASDLGRALSTRVAVQVIATPEIVAIKAEADGQALAKHRKRIDA